MTASRYQRSVTYRPPNFTALRPLWILRHFNRPGEADGNRDSIHAGERGAVVGRPSARHRVGPPGRPLFLGRTGSGSRGQPGTPVAHRTAFTSVAAPFDQNPPRTNAAGPRGQLPPAASRGDGPALRNVQHGARQRHLLG